MKTLQLILIPILFVVLLRLAFGASIFDDFLSVMSWTFFITVPAGLGALMVYYSPIGKVKSKTYTIFAPWIIVVLVIAVTILIGLEGWGCWIMITPLFFLFSSIGGLIARYFKLKNNKLLQKYKEELGE